MSLASASGLIGHTKEYIYRGIQQLPLIMTLTSFLLTVTTASIAHSSLFMGLAVFMPLFTLLSQTGIGIILSRTMGGREAEWSRSMTDVCRIVPSPDAFKKLEYYTSGVGASGAVSPSYWITSVGFLFGFFISNGADTLNSPVVAGADPVGHEKRYTQAVHILVSTCILFALIVGARFYFMGDCEGRGTLGKVVGGAFGGLSMAIGAGFYFASKSCGARSSDLFGVLSQMLPASATSASPVVCTQE